MEAQLHCGLHLWPHHCRTRFVVVTHLFSSTISAVILRFIEIPDTSASEVLETSLDESPSANQGVKRVWLKSYSAQCAKCKQITDGNGIVRTVVSPGGYIYIPAHVVRKQLRPLWILRNPGKTTIFKRSWCPQGSISQVTPLSWNILFTKLLNWKSKHLHFCVL